MDTENEKLEEEVVQEEEVTTTADDTTDESEEESVTLSKKEYKALDRKARAYEATKGVKQPEKRELSTEVDTDSVIKTVSALRGLADDEIESLESEATNLGVPLIKYIKSESGKTLLNTIRKDKKSKDASESMTSKSPVYKKHTMDDLSQMSSKELEKILPRD